MFLVLSSEPIKNASMRIFLLNSFHKELSCIKRMDLFYNRYHGGATRILKVQSSWRDHESKSSKTTVPDTIAAIIFNSCYSIFKMHRCNKSNICSFQYCHYFRHFERRLLFIITIQNCAWHSRQVSVWPWGLDGLLRLASCSALKESWILSHESRILDLFYCVSTIYVPRNWTRRWFFTFAWIWSLKFETHTRLCIRFLPYNTHTQRTEHRWQPEEIKNQNQKTFSVALRTTFSF